MQTDEKECLGFVKVKWQSLQWHLGGSNENFREHNGHKSSMTSGTENNSSKVIFCESQTTRGARILVGWHQRTAEVWRVQASLVLKPEFWFDSWSLEKQTCLTKTTHFIFFHTETPQELRKSSSRFSLFFEVVKDTGGMDYSLTIYRFRFSDLNIRSKYCLLNIKYLILWGLGSN